MPRNLEESVPSKPAYFWWLLANLLALCFAVTSWVFCLEIFGNSEVPRNYAILKKIGRVPVIKHYPVPDLPDGTSLTPEGSYRKYFGLNEEQRDRLNQQFLRNYLTGYKDSKVHSYIEGTYQITQVRELGANDFLPDGFAIRARAMVKTDDFSKESSYPVILECLFPAKDPSVMKRFAKGKMLKFGKTLQGAEVVYVTKILEGDESLVVMSAIPIVSGACQLDGIPIELEPPPYIRPGMGLPVFDR